MKFIAAAETDIGIVKDTNQDSLLIRHASTDEGEVLMAIVCDGMGGLAKGELASATVIRAFDKWFDQRMPYELVEPDLAVIGSKWALMLKELNQQILDYSQKLGASLGTTFTGLLFIKQQYLVVHVGDSRVYHIGTAVHQLTTDQTFVAREIRLGNMTPEQAKTDRRRNMLLQCVGASKAVKPEVFSGSTQPGVYMLCSDGFRHELTPEELLAAFRPEALPDVPAMHASARRMIELNKARRERDNISVILVKTK